MPVSSLATAAWWNARSTARPRPAAASSSPSADPLSRDCTVGAVPSGAAFSFEPVAAGSIVDRMIRLLLAFLIARAALPTSASAQERHMRVELVAESETPRAGSEIAFALVMTPDPGWHGYWLNTGDAGMPDRISWSLPEKASVTPPAYPVPERLIVAGLMNYVYSRPYRSEEHTSELQSLMRTSYAVFCLKKKIT